MQTHRKYYTLFPTIQLKNILPNRHKNDMKKTLNLLFFVEKKNNKNLKPEYVEHVVVFSIFVFTLFTSDSDNNAPCKGGLSLLRL